VSKGKKIELTVILDILRSGGASLQQKSEQETIGPNNFVSERGGEREEDSSIKVKESPLSKGKGWEVKQLA